MAERFARQRLRALAKVEGLHDDGKPTVLFLCVHNAGRSQMAMGFFTALAGDRAVAWSGGSEPGIEVNPAAVEAMAERGIDISGEFPKPWTDETVLAADVVITMGCGDVCPVFPGKRLRNGFSTTRQGGTCPVSDPSGTRSNAGSGTSCRNSSCPPLPAAARRCAQRGNPALRYRVTARSRAAPARQAVSQTDTDPHESHTLTRAGSAKTPLTRSMIPVITTPPRWWV